MNFEELSTEQINEQSMMLDELSPFEAARLMNKIDSQAAFAVESALPQIARAVEEISCRLKTGGRLLYAGAGTSGRLGVLDASECPPTFGVPKELVVGLIAGGDQALRRAIEGAEDQPELGRKEMINAKLCEKDVLVAISASGYAPYCIGALDHARDIGAFAIALTCNSRALMSNHADLAIEMPTGPEILSGSTRLKAGTATKMALNMLTTLSMIQMGKVYKNLMVDLSPSNNKLKDRAVRIIKNALHLDSKEAAESLLKSAHGQVKVAIVMGLSDASFEQAQKSLENEEGFVRRAVQSIREGI